MILDSEEQRAMILQALTTVPIQADYAGLCAVFPKMQATVEAVKAAKIEEGSDGGT
jgi:hypothetical protein